MSGNKTKAILRIIRPLPVLALAILASCDRVTGPSTGPVESYSPSEIYERGEYELQQGQPDDAAEYFGEIERLYPYSDLAEPALIRKAFAHHSDQDYSNSRAAAQRYLNFYPAAQDADYAQYLLALSYYDQIDEIGRDQALALEALQALRAVIENYPTSEYARSATLKFDLAFSHLASKQMEVGRYYLKRKHYAAAANRFRTVVEDFQTTTHTAEALHRLVETYLSLGLTDEAQTAGAILGHNFRSTTWYQDSYALLTGQGLASENQGDNWLSSIYRQAVRGEWL